MVYIISDTFSRINLAGQRKSKSVVTLNSIFCLKNLLVVYTLGFIGSVKVLNFKYLKVYLKYYFNSSVLRGLHVLSKNKYKNFVSYQSLKRIVHTNKFLTTGFIGISTSISSNILTDVECLLKRTGGMLCFYAN